MLENKKKKSQVAACIVAVYCTAISFHKLSLVPGFFTTILGFFTSSILSAYALCIYFMSGLPISNPFT